MYACIHIYIPSYINTYIHTCFPRRWKRVKVPITKPGKEDTAGPSKFRAISLINVGGKVLEKILFNTIMHHVYTNNLLNHNQFGFTPQKSTTDAAITVKELCRRRAARRVNHNTR